MPRLDISSPEFSYDDSDPESFRCGMFRMGPGLGAKTSGASIYELPPGRTICPDHYEYSEEEWLLVLEGQATLRSPAGEEQIGPQDIVFFPLGPEGAHSVRNDGETPVRVLMFSTRFEVSVAVYPDSQKVGVFTGNPADNLMVRRSSGVDYYDGEVEPAS